MNQDQEEREEWMYKPFYVIDGYLFFNRDFLDGLDTFIDFATSQPRFMNGEDIKCPCSRCRNEHFKNPDEVLHHILKYGFVKNYYFWLLHGERPVSKTKEMTLVSDHESNACYNNSDSDEVQEKLHKAKKKRKAKKMQPINKWDDDEVQKKSRKAKKNRLTEPEKHGTSIAKDTKESKYAQQTIASAKEKKVPTDPVTWEAFLRLNFFNGVFSDPESASIAEEVCARAEEMSEPLPGTTEPREVDLTAIYLDVSEKKHKAKKEELTNKWDDDDVQKKLPRAKKNRLTEPEKPGTRIAKRTEESKCAQQHTIASAKEKEVPTDPVTWEAFLRLNYFKGAVPDPKSAGIAAEVCARFEEMSRPLPGTSEERDVDMTALYLDVLNSQACSSIASTSTVNSGGSSELETKSIKRVKAQPSKAKWQSKAQLNCFGVGSLQCPSKPRSYEEMQTLLRAQEEEMQRRFLEQEEWLVDKEERLQEKEEELRDKELQLMEREKNAIRWAKKWDLLFPVPLPPTTSTDGNG